MACTLAVVALMVAADAVFLWQMTRVQNEVRRLYLADRRSAAAHRLHHRVMQFRERLESLALAQDAGQFEGEMDSFTEALSADAEAAREAMRTSESPQSAPLLAMVESIQSVLPPQSAAVAALVETGDWRAIRERLGNQLRALGLQTTALADTVDAEAAQEWAEALRTTERVRREVLSVVPATALLTAFLAVWLGAVVTRSITRPLTDVGAAARALAGGDFQYVIPGEGRDELSELAEAFNSTARHLRALYQALKDNEARFRAIADDTPAYLWMTSEEEEGTYLNRAFRDFLGIGAEVGGEVWSGRVHPEDADRVGANLRAATTCRRAHADEFRIRRADGEYRWVVNQGIPRISPTGEFLGYAGAVLDISKRKRAEEELNAVNQQLEQRVRERTAELEAANRELEAFAYSVSHDLRSPLRGINGWSAALEEDCGDQLDQQGRAYLGRLRAESQRMGELIDGLLQLSRIGRQPMKAEAVDLAEVARKIAARLEEQNPDRRIEFTIGQQGTVVSGDPRLLEIALTNLLENAVKFTGPREVARIEFGCEPEGSQLVYYVRDNGVGFDMEYVGTLFGAFQRLHRASEFPGTGIGLATVQRVIRRHGGQVWAEAKVGEGAVFRFTIGAQE